MKTLILLSLVILSTRIFADEKNKIIFEASFPEGFGVYLKREVTLKILDPLIGSKGEGFKKVFIVVPAEKDGLENKLIAVSAGSDELDAKLIGEFNGKSSIKVLIGGYEDIETRGIPGVSKSARSDEDFITPSGPGWTARNLFRMAKYQVIK